jgi:hypothetical protein
MHKVYRYLFFMFFCLPLLLIGQTNTDFGWQGKSKTFNAFIDGYSFSFEDDLYHISGNRIFKITDSDDGSQYEREDLGYPIFFNDDGQYEC